jgi:hypothetical protein
MPRIQSLYATGKLPTPISTGADLVALAFECDVPASGDGTALNDIIDMGVLPAGHVPVDVVFSADDLDTGTGTIRHSFGVLNSTKDDISTAAADGGAVWASGLDAAAAATINRPTSNVIHKVQASTAPRSLAFKVTTISNVKAAGKIRAFVICRAVP